MVGTRLPSIISNARQLIKLPSFNTRNHQGVPKGHVPVYVGDEAEKQRYVVPLSYLSQPPFQELLKRAEEEFGFAYPMGGLTIPCREDAFINLTYQLSTS